MLRRQQVPARSLGASDWSRSLMCWVGAEPPSGHPRDHTAEGGRGLTERNGRGKGGRQGPACCCCQVTWCARAPCVASLVAYTGVHNLMPSLECVTTHHRLT